MDGTAQKTQILARHYGRNKMKKENSNHVCSQPRRAPEPRIQLIRFSSAIGFADVAAKEAVDLPRLEFVRPDD